MKPETAIEISDRLSWQVGAETVRAVLAALESTPEYQALVANDARYREWRRAWREGECGLYNELCNADSDEEHDAAIDAARNG